MGKKKKIVYRDDSEEQLRENLLLQIKMDDFMDGYRNGGKVNASTSTYKRAPPKRMSAHIDPPLAQFNYAESVVTTKKKYAPKGTPCTTKKGKSGKVTKTGDCYPSGRKSVKGVIKVGVSPTGHTHNGRKVYHTSRGAFFTYGSNNKKIYIKRSAAGKWGFAQHVN